MNLKKIILTMLVMIAFITTTFSQNAEYYFNKGMKYVNEYNKKKQDIDTYYTEGFTDQMDDLLDKAQKNFKKAKSLMDYGDKNITRINENLKTIAEGREYVSSLRKMVQVSKTSSGAFDVLKSDVKQKTTYHNNGKIKSQGQYNYKTDKEVGLWKTYYENGQLYHSVEYQSGKREGEQKVFREDGTLKEIRYCRNGVFETYKAYNEKQKLIETGRAIDGKLVNDINYTYYDDKGIYIESSRNGIVKMFRNNGKMIITGKSENNKRVGEWTYYDENGNIVKKETYVNGVKQE